MNTTTVHGKLLTMLRLTDPFIEAVHSAHTIWSKRYPEWEAAFFDAHFLKTRVLPSMTEEYPLSAESLATEWVQQFDRSASDKKQLVAALTPVAADFLYLVEGERRFYSREAEKMQAMPASIGKKLALIWAEQ